MKWRDEMCSPDIAKTTMISTVKDKQLLRVKMD